MEQNSKLKWSKSKESFVYINGVKCFDFTSSIFTQNIGHSNPMVKKEINKQLKKTLHAYGYSTDIKEEYLSELKAQIPYKHFLLFSTGAEAIEASLKIAIHNGYDCVGFKRSMHGRTLGAEALVGKRYLPKIHTKESISKYFYESSPYSMDALFIEGYRGFDCKPINKTDWCNLIVHQNTKMIVFDEIQSGMYRTGSKFVYQYYNERYDAYLKPDILVLGKTVGGGLPLSIVCFNRDFNLNGLELTSTHSGQPLQMASGLGVFKYLNYMAIKNGFNILRNNISLMNDFFNKLDKISFLNNHIGMVGAFKVEDEETVYLTCLNNNILVIKTGKGWIKIAPSIFSDPKNLEKALNLLFGIMCREEIR